MSPHDQPLSRWNAQSLRSQIALVAQDDSLLQGTIARRPPFSE
jgi:ABC-type multidrug transport system fused ATPase/permease subunit